MPLKSPTSQDEESSPSYDEDRTSVSTPSLEARHYSEIPDPPPTNSFVSRHKSAIKIAGLLALIAAGVTLGAVFAAPLLAPYLPIAAILGYLAPWASTTLGQATLAAGISALAACATTAFVATLTHAYTAIGLFFAKRQLHQTIEKADEFIAKYRSREPAPVDIDCMTEPLIAKRDEAENRISYGETTPRFHSPLHVMSHDLYQEETDPPNRKDLLQLNTSLLTLIKRSEQRGQYLHSQEYVSFCTAQAMLSFTEKMQNNHFAPPFPLPLMNDPLPHRHSAASPAQPHHAVDFDPSIGLSPYPLPPRHPWTFRPPSPLTNEPLHSTVDQHHEVRGSSVHRAGSFSSPLAQLWHPPHQTSAMVMSTPPYSTVPARSNALQPPSRRGFAQ